VFDIGAVLDGFELADDFCRQRIFRGRTWQIAGSWHA